MLIIRFARVGRKNKAQFRVVLQQHTKAPTGRHVEVLGSYDPHQKKAVLKADKIKEWIAKGAQVSDTAYNLFVKEGIIVGKKRAVKIARPVVAEAEPVAPEVAVEEVKAAEAPAAKEETKTEEIAAPAEEAKVEETKAE